MSDLKSAIATLCFRVVPSVLVIVVGTAAMITLATFDGLSRLSDPEVRGRR